jgi:hypothetical protein
MNRARRRRFVVKERGRRSSEGKEQGKGRHHRWSSPRPSSLGCSAHSRSRTHMAEARLPALRHPRRTSAKPDDVRAATLESCAASTPRRSRDVSRRARIRRRRGPVKPPRRIERPHRRRRRWRGHGSRRGRELAEGWWREREERE